MSDVDVSGWRPAWLPAEDQLRVQARRLRALRGDVITASWLVWNLELDEWFADLPVVIEFARAGRLEVSWQKFDELSITWDTIDVGTVPRAWVTWPLEWRVAPVPALACVTGEVIAGIDGVATVFTTRRIAPPFERQSAWITTGMWLRTENSGLHIFNALDENGLDNVVPVPGGDLRRVAI